MTEISRPMLQNDRMLMLEAYRGICAIFVVVLHALGRKQTSLVYEAHLGVDMFFMLSGFILAFKYQDDLQSKKLSPLHFLLMRWIRLWPMVVLGVTFGLGAHYIIGAKSNNQLMTGLFTGFLMLPDFLQTFKGRITPLNLPLWSLFFEMVASALFGICLFRFKTLWLAGFAFGCGLLLLVYSKWSGASISFGYSWGNFWWGFPRLAVTFFLGVLVFRLHQKNKSTFGNKIGHYADVGLVICLIYVLALVGGKHSGNGGFEMFAILFVFPSLLYLGARVSITPALSSTYAILGFISYPIYLLHSPAIDLLKHLSSKFFVLETSDGPMNFVLFIVGLLLASAIVGKYYDQPMRQMLRKWCINTRLLKTPLCQQ